MKSNALLFSGALMISVALSAFVSGCATPPPLMEEPRIQSHIVKDFADHVPVDVAVLPVVDRSGTSLRFKNLMRDYVTEELTSRLYSPLHNDFVDEEVGSHPRTTPYDISRHRNSMGEDAILALLVDDFEVSYLPGYRKVRVGGSFQLFNSADGRLLWSREVQKKWIDIPGPVQPGALRTAERTAVREFVRFAFQDLPRRSVIGGRS